MGLNFVNGLELILSNSFGKDISFNNYFETDTSGGYVEKLFPTKINENFEIMFQNYTCKRSGEVFFDFNNFINLFYTDDSGCEGNILFSYLPSEFDSRRNGKKNLVSIKEVDSVNLYLDLIGKGGIGNIYGVRDDIDFYNTVNNFYKNIESKLFEKGLICESSYQTSKIKKIDSMKYIIDLNFDSVNENEVISLHWLNKKDYKKIHYLEDGDVGTPGIYQVGFSLKNIKTGETKDLYKQNVIEIFDKKSYHDLLDLIDESSFENVENLLDELEDIVKKIDNNFE